ncbi:ferredoxin-fold anticodon-binding domain-containing protein 1 isoform X2 [Mesocricetus auratus]|uniref:Ferredoxin-fold anticodon-binding domain-containing protein 1 isoform X2 n=1 Tax=Mesocricetus auratus TaxID=10036 RepID=A0A1U8BY41_MESAU|nr:ferredoxin-fold anticodon-binding domain-containing protein 1 isoform X2 [Mesocricetus auratus]
MCVPESAGRESKDIMVPRRLLLVGEGNFSFTASLIDTLDPGVSVTATCLQHPADLEGDPVTQENLQRLRERGVEVRFGVDCTQLARALQAHERDFDRIYFNFPHCGRKAGVAKNRELLAKFFQRSQAKSFRVEGAMNHVFTQSSPLEGCQPRALRVRLGDRCFSCTEPEALAGKLNRRFLEASSCHPVKTINEKLIAELGRYFPLKRLKCSFPLLSQGGTSVLPPGTFDPLPAFWVSLHEDKSYSESLTGEITQEMEDVLLSFAELALPKSPGRDGYGAAQEGTREQVRLRLRSSLLAHAEAVIQSPDFLPGCLHILSGPVFRKCHILPFMMPAFHETLFILGLNKNRKGTCLASLLDRLKDSLDNLLTETLLEGSSLRTSVEFVLQPNGKDHIIHGKSLHLGPDCTENLIIGTVVTSTAVTHKHPCFAFVSINLDLLAMLVYDISDWRILWTFDNRFLKRFAPGKIEHFKSYSLYPPCYVHDISFWLDEKKGFDELEFHTVARAVSQDTVISIQFLGRFQHPETAQVSLCYRLTYQACDKALSPQLAASMQSRFRREIQRQLHVSPR